MKVDMFALYKMINRHDINVIYSGPLWSDGIEGIGGTLRKRLEFDELPFSVSQAIFSVFVEQMNNMLMYSIEKVSQTPNKIRPTEAPKGIFVLGALEKKYFIQSGNIIKEENVQEIKERLDYLNTLDKAALRKYFKAQIKNNNPNPDSKGAGLGFIEIARRASSKVEYSFTPFGDGQSFFTLFVTIG